MTDETAERQGCGCESSGAGNGGGNGEGNGEGGCCRDGLALLTCDELAELSIDALITRYRRGVENLAPRIFNMPEEMLDYTFAPEVAAEHTTGLWSIRTLLGHCADAEVVYVHRFRRAVAEDAPVNPNWDETAFLDSGLYTGPIEGERGSMKHAPSIAGHVATIHTLRQWTAEWLGCLEEDQWERRLMHPWHGDMTLKKLVATQTWHLEHHARFLAAKTNQLLGPAASQGQGGGCCQDESANDANRTGCCSGSDG